MATVPVRVHLEQRGNDWVAFIEGKSSPVTEMVNGNSRPARTITWESEDEAKHSLCLMFGDRVIFY